MTPTFPSYPYTSEIRIEKKARMKKVCLTYSITDDMEEDASHVHRPMRVSLDMFIDIVLSSIDIVFGSLAVTTIRA
jgi:xanthine dehydrogenase iron-sulfur cluster and FAD-binding subunit A